LEKQETFGVPKMKFADIGKEVLKTHNTGTVPGEPGRVGYMALDKF
jgi:hypothetical protein